MCWDIPGMDQLITPIIIVVAMVEITARGLESAVENARPLTHRLNLTEINWTKINNNWNIPYLIINKAFII